MLVSNRNDTSRNQHSANPAPAARRQSVTTHDLGGARRNFDATSLWKSTQPPNLRTTYTMASPNTKNSSCATRSLLSRRMPDVNANIARPHEQPGPISAPRNLAGHTNHQSPATSHQAGFVFTNFPNRARQPPTTSHQPRVTSPRTGTRRSSSPADGPCLASYLLRRPR